MESTTETIGKFVAFYESIKITVDVCNGVAILRYTKLSTGEYLVKGKTVTGLANIEEYFSDQAL